jgi:transposase
LEAANGRERSLERHLVSSNAREQGLALAKSRQGATIDRLTADIASLEEEIEKTKRDWRPDHVIEAPTLGVEQLKAMLKTIDPAAAQNIIDYLKLDSFLLVKSIAKTINTANSAEAIAYKDGALGRNDALIDALTVIRKESFANFKEGAMRKISRKQ